MKTFNINRLTLVLITFLVAATAHAKVDFMINDIHLMETERGKEITVPVMARFRTPVDIWEINLAFPEGLTPIDVFKSYRMYFGTIDENGQSDNYEAPLFVSEDHTHIIGCTYGSLGYYSVVNEDGETVYEPYGSLKWDGYSYYNYYDELFYIKFYVDPSFAGGEIQVSGKASCGYDARNATSDFAPDPAIEEYTLEADINQDGTITITDVTELLNHLTGLYPVYYGGDVHQDGVIDLLDYEELMDYIVFGEWFTGQQLYTGQSNATSVEVVYPPVNEPAEAIFYINDMEINDEDLGMEITIPVGAHFSNYISSWDVQLTFPEGLTPDYATKGRDMTLKYYDMNGQEMTATPFFDFDDNYTHFIAASIDMGYQPSMNGEDPYETYGTVKWTAGDYDEMFLITCHVSPDFAGGNVKIITNASCGYDTRNDSMTFEPFANESHSGEGYLILPGDINMDGTINIADVTAFIDYFLDPSSSDYDYLSIEIGDMNRDDALNILDIDALCDYLIHGELYMGYALSQSETQAAFTVNFPDHTGDVNGDGFVTISDVTSLIDMLLNLDQIEYNELIDVNGDGYITISDVTALIDNLLR